MKRTTLALLILLSSVIFMSCRSADESLSTPPSTFAVEFSLGEIIDANKDLLLAEGIVTGRETSSIPDAFLSPPTRPQGMAIAPSGRESLAAGLYPP